MENLKTGYPSKDQMWNQYYDEAFLKEEYPQMHIYDYLKKLNKGREDLTAISYFGKEVSFNQFYDNVDAASKALRGLGVDYQDRIMYLMPNIPETAYLLYGTTQIGAVCDYVDPRPDSVDLKVSAKKILSLFQEEKAKYLIALDQCYLGMLKPIENELRELGVENIVVVSASDSMNLKSKLNYLGETVSFNGIKNLKIQLEKMKRISALMEEAKKTSKINIIPYFQLVKDCNFTCINPIAYQQDLLNLIVHTSGTSSPMPKPIPLTNDNLNAYVHQTMGANMTMAPGDRALQVLPYFAAYGVVDVVHAGLCHGNNLLQIPEFTPANFGKLILKYKPQTIIGAPTWFLAMMKDSSLKNADLSFIKMITYGGDSMDVEDEINFNKFLEEHNCTAKITKGHGMSETCGCASYAISTYNEPGSIGIPMPNTIYAIIDPETKKMIKFEDGKDYIEGELLISSRAVTSGKLDDKVIVPHVEYDGVDYIYTRDIVRMYKNGLMKFLTRSDRSFTRYDGFKIKPYEIEKIIKDYEGIKYCVVTPYQDEEKMGLMPMAHIVLDDDKELTEEERISIVKDIIQKQFVNNSNVSTRQIPTRFKFRTELPVSKNSKIDFNAIIKEEVSGDEVVVEMEETNISVGDINIYQIKKPFVKKLGK